ncbi:MAG: PQQ-binding-like beta-propeller repeat protein [Verrucomicrobiota bacterium]
MKHSYSTLFAIVTLLSISSGQANEFWPEIRGPETNGHASESKPPTTWSRSENIRWKERVDGKAWSTPIVVGDRIFISTAVESRGDISLRGMALDLKDGSVIWDTEIREVDAVRIHKKNSHASPSPIFVDGRVYFHFGHHGTACLGADDGAVVWNQTDLEYSPVHGNGGSPIIEGDHLIYSADGAQDPVVIALDIRTGTVAWTTPRNIDVDRTFSFSTPTAIEVAGETQVVLPGSGAIFAYDPKSGRELWRFRYGQGYSVTPRPLFYDGLLYASSGFDRAKLLAVRVDGSGDVTDTHLVWEATRAIPRESSFVAVDGLLYVNDDRGILSCFDAKTGEVHYQERMDSAGGYSSSPVYAGGHLYFHNGDGITTVVKPGTD